MLADGEAHWHGRTMLSPAFSQRDVVDPRRSRDDGGGAVLGLPAARPPPLRSAAACQRDCSRRPHLPDRDRPRGAAPSPRLPVRDHSRRRWTVRRPAARRAARPALGRRAQGDDHRRAGSTPRRHDQEHEEPRAPRGAPARTPRGRPRRAAGRPSDGTLVLPPTGEPTADALPDAVAWTKTDWQVWRARRWDKACKLVGMPTSPRPYDLRHSFASLLLAEGRSVHYVARRLGHSPALTLSTYGHLFAEYEHADRIDAEAEIAQARAALDAASSAAAGSCTRSVHRDGGSGIGPAAPERRKPRVSALAGLSWSTATGIRTPVSAVRGRHGVPYRTRMCRSDGESGLSPEHRGTLCGGLVCTLSARGSAPARRGRYATVRCRGPSSRVHSGVTIRGSRPSPSPRRRCERARRPSGVRRSKPAAWAPPARGAQAWPAI
jgi:hypothetical protein